jgi:PhnB protein
MPSPTPYVMFPGTAREALTCYGDVFGCEVRLPTVARSGRTDGPADAIAHGEGPVALFAAGAVGDEPSLRSAG